MRLVIGVPISQGAIQKIFRVCQTITEHYKAIGKAVHNAPVNHY
jgi:hypothetical protein